MVLWTGLMPSTAGDLTRDMGEVLVARRQDNSLVLPLHADADGVGSSITSAVTETLEP